MIIEHTFNQESRKNREDEINGKFWYIPNLYVMVDDSRYSLTLQ